MQERRPPFLLIGTDDREFSANRLKVSGIPYARKSLYSLPRNWRKIIHLLEDPSLSATIGKLTPNLFRLITESEAHSVLAPRLFEALGKKPHLLFIHTSILNGDPESGGGEAIGGNALFEMQDDDPLPYDSYLEYVKGTFLAPPSDDVRKFVLNLLVEANVSITPYGTNAEMAILAASFIDDHESNLLFRVYVPSGRLYAAEADRLLALFHDWLTQVGHHSVRQDGYSTAAGRVYEFFGDESLLPQEMSRQFNEFSSFLDLCAADPDAAEDALSRRGLAPASASDIVTRYGRSVRRINTDLRHERESRMLAIRHRLESELLDISEDREIGEENLESLVNELTPQASASSPLIAFAPVPPSHIRSGTIINMNQQIFQNLQGSVVQSIQGTVQLGAEAQELLKLVASHGGKDSAALESAVHELEDPDARQTERLGARAKLSGFLLRLGGVVETAGLAALQKYLESKLGVN